MRPECKQALGIPATALAAHPGITPAQASAAWASGALTIGLPALLWRWANLADPDRPGINAAGFLTPAFSVAWLLLFLEDATVAHWPTFAAGTLLVAVANMALAVNRTKPSPLRKDTQAQREQTEPDQHPTRHSEEPVP